MHGIGNDHDAQTILFWVRSHGRNDWGTPRCVARQEAPLGWEFLGTGSYRSVWLSPEGVAYKVGHTARDDQSGPEVDKLTEVWENTDRLPAQCRVPRFERYDVDGELVIAVEHIKGQTLAAARDTQSVDRELFRFFAEALHVIENRFNLWDMHTENAMVDSETGDLVVVDLGG